MKYSVIIPTYKRNEDLFSCLSCLAHYFDKCQAKDRGFDLEVIVSDDAQDNLLQQQMSSIYPWATYLSGPSRGPAANRNHGAKRATGEWLVFTDDDCLPQPGWLEAFVGHSDEAPVLEGRTSSCGTRTRVDEECPTNETGGYLWSCNFAIRKTLFAELGGFDENFPAAAMEDVDFRTLLEKNGSTTMFVPEARVLHPWRPQKHHSFWRKKAESISYFVQKHPEQREGFSPPAMRRKFAIFFFKFYIQNCLKYRFRGAANVIRNRIALTNALKGIYHKTPIEQATPY